MQRMPREVGLTVEPRRVRALAGLIREQWPALRALLVTVAIGLGGLSGIPETPPRQLQLLPSAARTLRETLSQIQAALLAPVRFVPDTLQFSQTWKLFSSANDARFLIWVEARGADHEPWQLVYRPHDPEHTWLEWTIEYRRVRGNWNPSRRGPNQGYDGFVSWVARRIFRDRPEFRRVRVRMEEIELLPNGLGFARLGRFFHERTRARHEVTTP